jgi:aspartate-semialdehyde dehydrogenase
MKSIKLGIVGATGMVGETFLKILDERKTPLSELRLFASEQSLGKKVAFRGQDIPCEVVSAKRFEGLDVVFFSSGDPISKEWAPQAVKAGAFAIDNSAAFRMDPNTALVVPEVNFHHIKNPSTPQIIANPNCSTIQMMLPLQALRSLEIDNVHVASYQSVSGAGKEAVEDLKMQTEQALRGETPQPGKVFKKPIAFDCHPIIGGIDDDGFCSEENKIVAETKKILGLPDIKVSAFTVRVPTLIGHAEAVWVTFKKETTRPRIIEMLKDFPNLKVIEEQDQFSSVPFAAHKEETFVSRIRQSRDFKNTWQMWVVSDNIRKGAASNGLSIAELLFK